VFEPRVKPISKVEFLEGHWTKDMQCLTPGVVVELRVDPMAPFNYGDFLLIKSIFQDVETQKCFLKGILYRRSCTLSGMLPRKTNEVYQVLQHNLADPRDMVVQSLHDVPVEWVTKIRQLRHTNALGLKNSFRTFEDLSGRANPNEYARENLQLTCRWKRIFTYANATDLTTGYTAETSIERFTTDECDEGFGIDDALLRRAVPYPSPQAMTTPRSKFTFADYFCGAGGMAIGARNAGFEVLYGVDHNADACATMRLNFPQTEISQQDVFDALTREMRLHEHVRCVHMSTVCKTLSPAYTVPGKNHDANEATLFCISDIIRKTTPMIATLEQTFGALHDNKKQLFASFVQQYTDLDYSVKWAKLALAEFGVPQSRERLIMIGSCPGHPLPDFPVPTHSPKPGVFVEGLEPTVTIADAFSAIPEGAPNHDPGAQRKREHMYPTYSFNSTAKCLTTSGGIGNHYPDGTRLMTGREYASLQTFPMDYAFVGNRTSVTQQVGNAVPPVFARKLWASIRSKLEEVDELDTQWDAALQQREGGTMNPIELLDDEQDMGKIDRGVEYMDLT
jgi:DNA (cytosine-5)-methyltransferase 1